MRNTLAVIIIASFMVFIYGNASADVVSFVWNSSGDTIQGVDGDTSWWSNDDNVKNLYTSSWSLLNGVGTLSGYANYCGANLSQTGTRGIGIFGGSENDEIDTGVFRQEKLVVTFSQPAYLNSFEVRSLFYEPVIFSYGYSEVGNADFWLNGEKVYTQSLIGQENIDSKGTDGSAIYSYDTPLLVDKVVFYVPSCELKSYVSDFSVAKMDVTTAPEPVSTALFILGGTTLLVRRIRRRK